ncbi:low molecular weight phosphatase family protein [Streptomyces chartreusis]|uniref:phosphotyrosine protein phosphatase n=1 Tax=Streptomyces chartreusis TaxID=1969 RepID=UPI003829C35B
MARLALRYRGRLSAETIQRLVIDSYDRPAERARVRTRLVVPAEHLATERLDALAHIEGAPGCGLPLAHRAGGHVVVQAADILITMGCGDACPVPPGRRCLDWPVTDPEGAPIAVVRSIRDEIDAHITELLASLSST